MLLPLTFSLDGEDDDDGDDDDGEQSLVRNDQVIESGLCPNDDQGLSF